MMFADDIVLRGMEREEVDEKTKNGGESWKRGLRISCKKTEYMQFNEAVNSNIRMQGYVLKRLKCFKYLESTLSDDGELEGEVERRI